MISAGIAMIMALSLADAPADDVSGRLNLEAHRVDLHFEFARPVDELIWSENYFMGKLVVQLEDGQKFMYMSKTYAVAVMVVSSPLKITKAKGRLSVSEKLDNLIYMPSRPHKENGEWVLPPAEAPSFHELLLKKNVKVRALLRVAGPGINIRDLPVELQLE